MSGFFKLTDASHKAFAKRINESTTQDDDLVLSLLSDHESGVLFGDSRANGVGFAEAVATIGRTHLMNEWDAEQVAFALCGLIVAENEAWDAENGEAV